MEWFTSGLEHSGRHFGALFLGFAAFRVLPLLNNQKDVVRLAAAAPPEKNNAVRGRVRIASSHP